MADTEIRCNDVTETMTVYRIYVAAQADAPI